MAPPPSVQVVFLPWRRRAWKMPASTGMAIKIKKIPIPSTMAIAKPCDEGPDLDPELGVGDGTGVVLPPFTTEMEMFVLMF